MRNNLILLVFQFYINDFPSSENGFTFTSFLIWSIIVLTVFTVLTTVLATTTAIIYWRTTLLPFCSFLSLTVRNFTPSLQMEIIDWYF